jgi:hypothetical protein
VDSAGHIAISAGRGRRGWGRHRQGPRRTRASLGAAGPGRSRSDTRPVSASFSPRWRVTRAGAGGERAAA